MTIAKAMLPLPPPLTISVMLLNHFQSSLAQAVNLKIRNKVCVCIVYFIIVRDRICVGTSE